MDGMRSVVRETRFSREDSHTAALDVLATKAEEHGLVVERVTTSKNRTVRKTVRISGKRVTVHGVTTLQKNGRAYAKINRSALRDVEAVILVFILPQDRTHTLVIPKDALIDGFADTLEILPLTLPFLSLQKGRKPRTHDWWIYEDNWTFFTPEH
jgi:hypothetical protein